MAPTKTGIHLPAIQPQQCPIHLYEATESSSGPNEELGGTMHSVPVVFLGFIINLNKSVVEPLHTITFLEFLLNSTMTIALPQKCSSDSAVGEDIKSNTDPSQN